MSLHDSFMYGLSIVYFIFKIHIYLVFRKPENPEIRATFNRKLAGYLAPVPVVLEVFISDYFISDQPPPAFAVAAVNPPSPLEDYTPPAPQDAKSIIDSIFDGISWLAVPKRRRSVQKMMMRRMGPNKIRKFGSRKHNIIACLECGHWHQRHTLCGKNQLLCRIEQSRWTNHQTGQLKH